MKRQKFRATRTESLAQGLNRAKGTVLVRSWQIVLIVLAIPSTSFARPLPDIVEGRFSFQNHYRVVSVINYENVDTRLPAGKSRLQWLWSQKYQCVAQTSQFYACKKFVSTEEVSPALDVSVREEAQGYLLTLDLPSSDPTLITDGDVVQEWEVPQVGRWQTQKADRVVYRIGEGYKKILLYFGGFQNMWTINQYANALFVPRNFLISKTSEVWQSILVEVELNRDP